MRRAIPTLALAILCLGFLLSLYWQFAKGLRPCPFCQALRWLYFGGAVLGVALWKVKGEEWFSWCGLVWAVPVSSASVYPLLTECLECLKKEGMLPFFGPLSAYHLALLGAVGVAMLSSVSLFLPTRAEGRLRSSRVGRRV